MDAPCGINSAHGQTLERNVQVMGSAYWEDWDLWINLPVVREGEETQESNGGHVCFRNECRDGALWSQVWLFIT